MTNDKFRDAIFIDFGNLDFDRKRELDILMRRPKTAYRTKINETDDIEYVRFLKDRGYTVKYNKQTKMYEIRQPIDVSQKQLDGAWDYLKGRKIKSRDKYKPPTVQVHYYHKQVMFRDKKTGRFVPTGNIEYKKVVVRKPKK